MSYKANLLAKIRRFLTNHVALKIYKSMILPYCDYGDVIYNAAGQEGLEKLQRLQKWCLKISMGFNIRYGTRALYTVTKMPRLEHRRSAHINNFMYNRLNRTELVDNRAIKTTAHDAPLFKVVTPKLEAYKRSVQYAGALQWNGLPKDYRSIKNFESFKSKQKAVMLSNI